MRDSGCALRVFGVISGPDQTASLQINAFDVQDHDYTDYIDLLAYGKHMFWLQTSEETTRPTWAKWDSQMNTHVRYFPSANWGDMLPYRPEIEKPPPLPQRKHCSMCAKSVSTPGSFYDINGVAFDRSSLVVPEFRAWGLGRCEPFT